MPGFQGMRRAEITAATPPPPITPISRADHAKSQDRICAGTLEVMAADLMNRRCGGVRENQKGGGRCSETLPSDLGDSGSGRDGLAA